MFVPFNMFVHFWCSKWQCLHELSVSLFVSSSWAQALWGKVNGPEIRADFTTRKHIHELFIWTMLAGRDSSIDLGLVTMYRMCLNNFKWRRDPCCLCSWGGEQQMWGCLLVTVSVIETEKDTRTDIWPLARRVDTRTVTLPVYSLCPMAFLMSL